MRTDRFSDEAMIAAYHLAEERASRDFESFAEESKVLDFAVSSLGAGLSMDVE